MLRKQGMKRSMPRFDIVGQLGPLRRYAQSLTRDSADAEDLVHDALVRAYERRGTFRSGGNLRAWLLSIVHNAFVDRIRSRRSEAVRVEQAEYLADASMPASQEHSVRLAQVRDAFFNLPEEQRSALHLVAIEGLSYQQAANATGVPLGTLMSRIGRARAALRQMENAAPARGKNHLRIVGGDT
ncbi:sigma-70 family RNA polymerase sigma factor [Mesorhizobium sp. B2-3-3]|nr:sigma-70 family RNA polymerase sigma factor [Mesorhizobium sp. B2-3-3]